jgi:radical SAM superfamily enzyme YgiQ (UPF0313 family)
MPKRVLLMLPPCEYKDYSWSLFPSPGILSLLAVARRAGHEVKYIDCVLENYSWEQARDIVQDWNPDYFGMSVLSSYAFSCYRMAEIVKRINPSITVLLGGQHATGLDLQILQRHPSVDCIVRGEGEATVEEILERGISPSVKGIAIRDRQGNPFRTDPRPPIENLDSLPIPAYDLVNMKGYFRAVNASRPSFHRSLQYTNIITSRGCFAKCNFCGTPKTWGGVRHHSPQRVCDIIEMLIKDYQAGDFWFNDDIFPPRKAFLREFAQEVKRRGLKFRYTCELRVDQANQETLDWLKETGCYHIFYGVESGSEKILKLVNKGATVKTAEEGVKRAVKSGLSVGSFWMVGFPTETEQDIKETIDLATRLSVSTFYFAVTRLLPNTVLLDKHQVPDEAWFEGYETGNDSAIPTYRDFHPTDHTLDLNAVVHYANLKNYSRHVWRRIGLFRKSETRNFFEVLIDNIKLIVAAGILYGGNYPFTDRRSFGGRCIDLLWRDARRALLAVRPNALDRHAKADWSHEYQLKLGRSEGQREMGLLVPPGDGVPYPPQIVMSASGVGVPSSGTETHATRRPARASRGWQDIA